MAKAFRWRGSRGISSVLAVLVLDGCLEIPGPESNDTYATSSVLDSDSDDGSADEDPSDAESDADSGSTGEEPFHPHAEAVSTGYGFTCALLDGAVYCWGDNSFGQLGRGAIDFDPHQNPEPVDGIVDAVQVSAGWFNACARRSNGQVSCWGRHIVGQSADSPVPVEIDGLASAIEVSASSAGPICGLFGNGELKCMGISIDPDSGLTDDSLFAPEPVTVSSIPPLASVAIGGYSSPQFCGLTAEGAIWIWGRNDGGIFIENGQDQIPTPVLFESPDAGIVASVGALAFCVGSTQSVRCWPPGDTGSELPFVGGYVESLSLGSGHGCVVDDGKGRCWGANSRGQLGTGTTMSTGIPTVILEDLVEISAGGMHSCALENDGDVRCWGDNFYGQLGYDAAMECDGSPCALTPGFVEFDLGN